MKPFTHTISIDEKEAIDQFREELLKQDKKVAERVGKIMSTDRAFVYEQEGVFKYGIAKTKHHYSFHSMVMYAFPEVADFLNENLSGGGIKIQKGCINFYPIAIFPLPVFKEMMALSAAKDFSLIIAHYQDR